ncbi:MAG: hypothetical protein ACREJD_09330 [Phycisphaerales bacterium]
MNLLNGVKLTKIAEATGSGTSQVDSSILDMSGFEGVVFFTNMATANAGNFIKATAGKVSNLSDGADLAGSKVTTGTSDEAVLLEIAKPLDRYIRCSAVRGAATVCGEIWAAQYGARTVPVTNSLTGTQISKILASPAYGTA